MHIVVVVVTAVILFLSLPPFAILIFFSFLSVQRIKIFHRLKTFQSWELGFSVVFVDQWLSGCDIPVANNLEMTQEKRQLY